MSTVTITNREASQMVSGSPFIFTTIGLTPMANNFSLYKQHNVTFYTRDLNAINTCDDMCQSTPQRITAKALSSPYTIDRNNPYSGLHSASIASPSPGSSPFHSQSNMSEDTCESEHIAINIGTDPLEEQIEADRIGINRSFTLRNSSTSSPPCYIPFECSKLPQFHPPRFSRRLRTLIEKRQRPLYLTLPVHNDAKLPAHSIVSSQSTLETPKSRFHVWFHDWCNQLDPRLLLLLSVIFVMGMIMLIAWKLTASWGY